MPPSRLRRAQVTCGLGLVLLASASASDRAAGLPAARTLDPADAFKLVAVGPGYVESSARQVVRTAADRVYIFAADDTAQRLGRGQGVIRAWKSDVTGIPTSFSEVDGADRPVAAGDANVLESVDARLDRAGVVHLVYVDETTNDLIYRTFSTTTDAWGPPTVIASDVDANFYIIKRSRNMATIVLDNEDQPQVVYASGTDLFHRAFVQGAWTVPTLVASDSNPVHPQLAVDGTDTLHLSWLHNDGSSSSVKYTRGTAGGSWAVPETVASADVQDNDTGDQGPSIVLTPSGVPYILYVTPRGTSWVRIKHQTSSGWAYDNPDTNLYTHAPQIYAQNDDIYAFLGHDDQIRFGYDFRLSDQPWANYVPLTSTADGTLDGSASVRWDPQRDADPGVIDTAFFDEDRNDDGSFLPQLYYMAVLPSGVGTASDTTPPSVAVTSPVDGATVSGTVELAASAADNVGVAGVQFELDGLPLGAVDTSVPYALSWDTSTVALGEHVLTAIARDAAGNSAVSSRVGVTVQQAGPGPSGSLVAAYGFDEGVGTAVADASGHGHGGTVEGASWTREGKFGSALAFDGTHDWVTVADASDLDLSQGMTLEAWVRPSALGTSWRTVLFKERSGGVVYSLYANQSSGLPDGQVYIGGEQNATGSVQLPLATWTHLAVTFDGASLRLYVDGTLTRTTAVSGAMSGSDGPLRIGGNAIWDEWFDGLIDELRIYNRALSPTEIQTDMNAPVGGR
jgi:Concanavalin A-like lectin/glucanases superfamily/Bacterial Ig domain